MNYLVIAEAVLAELGVAKEAKKANEAPLNSLNSLNSHGEECKREPRWQIGERQELEQIDNAGQALVIGHLVKTGAVLVLEAEDGTLYRCHAEGMELPADIATLPRYELPQLEADLARQPCTAEEPPPQSLAGRPSPTCDALQP